LCFAVGAGQDWLHQPQRQISTELGAMFLPNSLFVGPIDI
jgi:hypothetical protein